MYRTTLRINKQTGEKGLRKVGIFQSLTVSANFEVCTGVMPSPSLNDIHGANPWPLQDTGEGLAALTVFLAFAGAAYYAH